MSISKKAISLITNDLKLRAKLLLVMGKGEPTLIRWLKTKSDVLTMPKYTQVISEHTGLSIDEIIEPVKEKIS